MSGPGREAALFPYQAYWCEENVWQLAHQDATRADERFVVLLTGASGRVACWEQKAGAPGEPVLWDYHVVLAVKTDAFAIWDLDSRLGMPVPATHYLEKTFPFPRAVPEAFQPRFACVDAQLYLSTFGSDRAHMRDRQGLWRQPPPPWPPIEGRGLTLAGLISDARNGYDLAALQRVLT
ncbi:MAG: hypothetical protein KA712_10115 [Myxococcales bacterium]|nr:hypothetical protein [Myxococcales bacterium]